MIPKEGFDAAMERADHLIALYDLCCDTRDRGVRSDWADKFKRLMRWPAHEKIVRVDGKDRNSLVILRQAAGIDRHQFAHDYVSELLRAAIVTAISALDRYLHDLVVKHCWRLLQRKEDDIPRELRDFSITALDVRKAIDRLRRNPQSRPGYVVKEAIQARLHRDFTFQNPDSVNRVTCPPIIGPV